MRAIVHHGLVDDGNSGVVGWIREIVLDTPDPWGLARFWAEPLDGTPVEWYPGWVTLEPLPRGQRLSFQATGAGCQDVPWAARLVHFDVLVGDLAADVDACSVTVPQTPLWIPASAGWRITAKARRNSFLQVRPTCVATRL